MHFRRRHRHRRRVQTFPTWAPRLISSENPDSFNGLLMTATDLRVSINQQRTESVYETDPFGRTRLTFPSVKRTKRINETSDRTLVEK